MCEPVERPRERKVIKRSTYEAVSEMIAEGCPNSLDLEDYEIVEDEPPASKAGGTLLALGKF